MESLVEPSEELLLAIIDYNAYYFQFFKDEWRTEAVCLEAVKQDGNALYHVKNQTEEICLAAVKQYYYALYYIKDKKMKEWVIKQLTTI